MANRVSLVVENKLAELDRVLAELTAWCEANALPEETLYELKIIVDEVASNIIRHGFQDGTSHSFQLDLSLSGGDVSIDVVDEGVHFNPLIIPPPDLSRPIEERRPGGLGIYMVKNLVDDLEYRRENGKNFLTLRKKAKGS